MTPADTTASRGMAQWLPALHWLKSYQRAWLRPDLIAGLTLAACLLPAGIGDASLAQLQPEAGLHACLFSGLVFWLFCSSRHTSITVTSAMHAFAKSGLSLTGHLLLLALTISVAGGTSRAEPLPREIEYAVVDGLSLKLDLYVPEMPKPLLIVFVHGGAWRAGSRGDMPLGGLVAKGFAIASVDYRLSTRAPFPAQVHDIKAAIRFLRAEQSRIGINANRIVIAGSSAGGHLAALVGVSNRNRELEGKIGDRLDQSSGVQGIVSFYGASNLTSILGQSTGHGLKMRVPALQLLLGGQPGENPELTRLASPVFHVDPTDPPLLLIHGDADPQMPPEQSKELATAYRQAGLPVTLVTLPGAVHGGKEFYDRERLAVVEKFLGKDHE